MWFLKALPRLKAKFSLKLPQPQTLGALVLASVWSNIPCFVKALNIKTLFYKLSSIKLMSHSSMFLYIHISQQEDT